MKSLFKNLWIFFIPLLTILVVSCEEDEVDPAAKPSITEVSPEMGIQGTPVTITGLNLAQVQRVMFGGEEVEFSATETTITAVVPEGVAPGNVDLAVYLPNGSDRVQFKVLSQPTIMEVGPESGKPRTEVTVTGTYLNDITKVTLGGAEMEFTATPTALTFVVPDTTAPGTTTITVTSPGGSATGNFEVTALDPLTATAVSPAQGLAGTSFTISGTNLQYVQNVMVGNTPVQFESTQTGITATIPKATAAGDVKVTVDAPNGTEELTYTVLSNPTVTSVSPLDVRVWEDITVSGTNLDQVDSVVFAGGVEGFIVSSSSEEMIIKALAGTGAKKGAITFVAANGDVIVSTDSIRVRVNNVPMAMTVPPTIEVGKMITIEGEKLDLATEVIFPGGVKATVFGIKTATQIQVKVPEGIPSGTGTITFVTADGKTSHSPETEVVGGTVGEP